MESYSALSEFHSNPIIGVSCVFENTRISHSTLDSYIRSVKKAHSVSDLSSRIRLAVLKFHDLAAFDSCSIEVHPGAHIDTAEVIFKLKDKRFFGVNIGVDSDPFQLKFLAYLRNLFHRPNKTNFSISMNPFTRKYNYEVIHEEKIFPAEKLQFKATIGKYSGRLDTNIEEKMAGAMIGISNMKGSHLVEFGKTRGQM